MQIEYNGEQIEIGFWQVFNAQGADLGLYAGRDADEAIDVMLDDAGVPVDADIDPGLCAERYENEDAIPMSEREAMIQMWRGC